MGIQITSFNEQIFRQYTVDSSATESGQVFITYNHDDATGIISGEWTTTVGADQTWENLADGIVTTLETQIAAISPDFVHTLRLQRMWWNGTTFSASTYDITVPFGRINMDKMKIHFTATSNLLVQNRTLAEAQAGDNQHYATDHVEQNPVRGNYTNQEETVYDSNST